VFEPGRHMRAVVGAGNCPWADPIVGKCVWLELALLVLPLREVLLVDEFSAVDLNFVHIEGVGFERLLGHRQGEIAREIHRQLILFGKIERLDGLPEALVDRCRREDKARNLAVTAVEHRVEVALFLLGRHPGRWPGAHDVGDHQWGFCRCDEAEGFGHEVDPWPGGRGHRSRARSCGSECHIDRREFVFGLDDVTAVPLDAAFQILHYVGRGCDRIAGVVATAGGDRPHPDGLVAVQ